uniref:Helitron helicase-like domain-containing protein n=1 Tax=Strigamia maritima TaxID=126957 RepID=T1IKK0_STRMM
METPNHIKRKYAEVERESPEKRRKRLANKRMAKSRHFKKLFNDDEAVKNQNQIQHAERRQSMDAAAIVAECSENRIQHAARRRPAKLQNIAKFSLDDFQCNMMIGENVLENRHCLPRMIHKCNHCDALKWNAETKGCCCSKGEIQLAPIQEPPPRLSQLFRDKEFLINIRFYNSMFALTSLEVNLDTNLASNRHGVYTYRIQGQLVHRMGSLLPVGNDLPQHYIYDTDMQAELHRRRSIFANQNLSERFIKIIQEVLDKINPFAQLFRRARDILQQSTDRVLNLAIRIHEQHSMDRRRYNKPTESEVAILINDDPEVAGRNRDIILRTIAGPLQRINETHGAYDPLQYPLIFPYGWHPDIPFAMGATARRSHISVREYTVYRLYTRENVCSTLHLSATFPAVCG